MAGPEDQLMPDAHAEECRLECLPRGVALRVIQSLGPRELVRLGCCSHHFHSLVFEDFRQGLSVVSLVPELSLSVGHEALRGALDLSRWPLVRKNHRPGIGAAVGSAPVNVFSTAFEVEIVRHAGVGIEIGLARASAFAHGVLQKNRAWLFDCWGRCSAGSPSGVCTSSYGEKVPSGARVGVVYSFKEDTLTFLVDGVSMGPAISNLAGSIQPGELLYPVVALPFLKGEAICFTKPMMPLGSEELRLREWRPAPHEDDDKVIVETTWETTYRTKLDVSRATVYHLKRDFIENCAPVFTAQQLDIRIGGQTCRDSDILADCGIVFGKNRTHLCRVLLIVPHEAS